jgi:UDP-GlcNAc:undecaprenyl-phosphate GlcNAc-1-phosphate transferase
MSIVTAGFLTSVLGLLFTFAVRTAACRIGVVALPRADRWHQKPTALLGGVAIYSAFIAGFLLFGQGVATVPVILAAGSVLFVAGLVDDLVQIKPYMKLVIQLLAAAIVVYWGLELPWTDSEAINDLITIFWLVGITNAINLLDNMDGLAGGISVISSAFLAVTFLMNGQIQGAMLAAILGGAVLGFLVFNFNPASIFMGDCGSMFLGFSLGGLALLSEQGKTRNLMAILLTPVLILMIPIFDTCVVTITRKLSGRPISQGGRDHTSHRLVALGMSERSAVLRLYLFAAVSGLLALTVRIVNQGVALLVVPGFALVVIFVGLYLGKVRIYERENQLPDSAFVRLLTDFSYKRRIFEVLLDLTLIPLAYYAAYLLRFEGQLPQDQVSIFLRTLPVLIFVEMLVLLAGGVYRGLWRYVGLQDLVVIARAVLLGGAISAGVVLYMYGFAGPSRAVLVLNGLLLLIFVGASRLSFRLLRVIISGQSHIASDATPILIYGAGDGGELLVREILNNPEHRFNPVGFIDDDTYKAGKLLHGFRIFESRDLPDLVRKYGVSEVLVSSFKVSETRLDDLRGMGLSLRRMRISID